MRSVSLCAVLLSLVCGGASAADVTCATCHKKQATSQPGTFMAHALMLRTYPKLTKTLGGYTYTVETRGGKSTYSVTDGVDTIAVPIRWAFGAKTQTWVLERNGKLYESLVSFYPKVNGLDVTMGDQHITPTTLLEAFGRELPDRDVRACFDCHATGAVVNRQVQFETLKPGVQCGRCHTGANEHLKAISKGKSTPMPARLGKMTPEDTSNFCGQCHRTWDWVVRNRLRGEATVRFQPYRLANSACYDGGDSRISCTACHDPHQDPVVGSAAYDEKCLACHSTAAVVAKQKMYKACPVGKAECSSCHMPKVPLPGGHQTFTDHHIRVVKAGEPYPN
ncbi:MAG TPA: multiheme c-type cytochrome [Bryobacteraceae bacterium]|nr:multiheme c-type cytochrome [Bryobacteraceae bacterium]